MGLRYIETEFQLKKLDIDILHASVCNHIQYRYKPNRHKL